MSPQSSLKLSVGALAMLVCAVKGSAGLADDTPAIAPIKVNVGDSAQGEWNVCGPHGCAPVEQICGPWGCAMTSNICSSNGCDPSGSLNATTPQAAMDGNATMPQDAPTKVETDWTRVSEIHCPRPSCITKVLCPRPACLCTTPPCKVLMKLTLSSNSTVAVGAQWDTFCAPYGGCELAAIREDAGASVAWTICGGPDCMSFDDFLAGKSPEYGTLPTEPSETLKSEL